MAESREVARFHPLFESWARRVRSRLLARRVLTGVTLGLALSVLPAAVAWQTRHGALRPLCALLGVAGASAGLVVARRRRWNDVDVALWLDDRLGTQEAIATAVELRNGAEDEDAARAVVVSTAATALAQAPEEDVRRARPVVLRPLHALAPLAIAALVFVARSPLPAAPVVAAAPGESRVQMTQVEGLKKVVELGKAHARDEAQRQRLDALAKDADKLRVDLEKGLEKRDALDRIAKLRDDIAAEKLTLGDGERRAGLEAAISKLQQKDATKEAAKALGDHDLEKMDREMERIANAREKQDRDSARHALDDAAAAARSAGAPDVGKALEEQKQALEQREKRAEALRDLEKAMEDSGTASPEQQTESEALDRKGDDATARKLADAMGKALEKLTPEQRRRLAQRLREQARQQGKNGPQSDPQALKDMADGLSTAEGEQKLEDELQQLAEQDDQSPESQGQQDLDGAEQGADGAEGQLNGQGRGPGQVPAPGKGHGPGQAQGQGDGQGESSGGSGAESGDGSGSGGHHHDTGTGPHDGHTGEVDTGTLRSRARGPMSKAPGMPGATTGWTPGRADGTANVRGTGALGAAGPGEIEGVDHSDVPEEYREQVRQYFQP